MHPQIPSGPDTPPGPHRIKNRLSRPSQSRGDARVPPGGHGEEVRGCACSFPTDAFESLLNGKLLKSRDGQREEETDSEVKYGECVKKGTGYLVWRASDPM